MNIKIETKSEIHKIVYYMKNNKICKDFVDRIHIIIFINHAGVYTPIITYQIRNNPTEERFNENQVFLTKEDLIKHISDENR